MKQDLTVNELGFIYGQMEKIAAENPKARVVYDLERQEILITYPLPVDFHNNKLANDLGMKY